MNTQFSNYQAVILANGEYPSHEVPLSILQQAAYLACCDGAANACIANGFTPDAIVGDGDSLSDEVRMRFADRIHRISEQETNDLTKTVAYLRSIGKHYIAIVGATGLREDHTLGNISLLMEYMRMGVQVAMFTDYGVFIPCNGKQQFACSEGQQVSIFNFGAKHFVGDGLRYPIYDFTNWWQGTLNECIKKVITIDADGDYLLYFKHVE